MNPKPSYTSVLSGSRTEETQLPANIPLALTHYLPVRVTPFTSLGVSEHETFQSLPLIPSPPRRQLARLEKKEEIID